jgi:hypothetical protein
MEDKLYTLSVEKLVCVNQEDWVGKDHIEIRLFADGKKAASTHFYVSHKKNQNTRTFAKFAVGFSQYASIVIIELDPDGNDQIGTWSCKVGQLALGLHYIPFVYNSKVSYANYTVVARIADVGQAPLATTPIVTTVPKSHLAVAQELQAAFQAALPAGVWSHITAQRLAEDLDARLQPDPDKPGEVWIPPSVFVGKLTSGDKDAIGPTPNQGSTSLCGAACIVFELWRRPPDRYAAWVIALFSDGSFNGRTEAFAACADLSATALPNDMNAADWILMTSLQDAANLLIDYAGEIDPWTKHFEAGSLWPQMSTWCREILYMKQVHWISTYVYGEADALHQAWSTVSEQKGVAFLNCNADQLLANPKELWYYPWGDHWATLYGKMPGHNLAKKIVVSWWLDYVRYCFRAQSWGLVIDVVRNEDGFEDLCVGFLRAWDEDLSG